MRNAKQSEVVSYMLRYLLTKTITDPLSQTSREYSDYAQYFSGTGVAGQINYLERKPTTAGRFSVKVNIAGTWTTKTDGVDFTLDRTNMTITWTGYTPASDNDNVYVEYQAVKAWIYDDHPYLEGNTFPRITVQIVNEDVRVPGIGIFNNYSSGIGNYIEMMVKVIIRNRMSNEFYSYGSVHYKNFDLINALAQTVTDFVNNNRQTMLWKFYDWEVIRSERIMTEEDQGVLRKDITLKVKYFEKTTAF